MKGGGNGDDGACLNVHTILHACNMSGLNSGMSNRSRSTWSISVRFSLKWPFWMGEDMVCKRFNGSSNILFEEMMMHSQSIAFSLLWMAAPLVLCDLIYL